MDDDFFHHSSHIDNTLIQKIEKGEYVDLEKLLPRDKVIHNDGHLQMIQSEGNRYMHLKPVTDKDPPVINTLCRWEQAFEIYATIHTAAHPNRSSELFKHMYNIRSAASTFTWDNIYNYDITFRRLMVRYPDQNWGVIYQQGWTLLLKDKMGHNNNSHNFQSFSGKKKPRFGSANRDKICWKFNKGKCPHGSNCRFEHKCLGCMKTDHGYNVCSSKRG